MKKFYNNTIMSGALSKALRVLALLCVLLGVSGSAWAATTIYFDNTATKWSNVYVCLDAEWVDYYVGSDNVGSVKTQGKTSYQMTKVTGNIYKYDFGSNVSASRVVFIKDNQGNYNNLYNTEASYRADMNLGANNMFTVSKSSPKSSNGTTYYNEGTWSTYNAGGGSGGDSGDDSGNCNSIEIYCRYDGSDNHNMNLYIWDDSGNYGSNWPGKAATEWAEMDSKWYAKWVVETTNDNICVKFNAKDDNNYQTANICNLKSGNKYYYSIPSGEWNGKSANLDKTEVINCGGGDTPTGDCVTLPGSKGDCQKIEIYSKNNYNLYAFQDGNGIMGNMGNWNSAPKGTATQYNGSTYYKWEINGYDYIQIIFKNSDGKQSGDSDKLYGGYAYVFDGQFVDGDNRPKPCASSYKATDCSGGDIGITCDRIEIYCKYLENNVAQDMKVHVWGSGGSDTGIDGGGYHVAQNSVDGYQHWEIFTDKTNICIEISNKDENYKSGKICGLTKGKAYYFDIPQHWSGKTDLLARTEDLAGCNDVYSSTVILTRDAAYNEDTNKATVYGYLKQNTEQDGGACDNLTYYGFAFCKGAGCIPSTAESKCGDYIHATAVNSGTKLDRGVEFTGEFFGTGCETTQLEKGAVYGYRAYVYDGAKVVMSAETRYFSTGGCIPVPGGGAPIEITVDAETYFKGDTTQYDDCRLIYGNLQRALNHLKANTEYTNTNGNLRQPVIITVANLPTSLNEMVTCGGVEKELKAAYKGIKKDVQGGDNGTLRNLNVLAIEGFNSESGYNPKNTLTIRAKEGHNPRVQHMLIRKSRYVIVDGIAIMSNADECGKTKDTALDIDNGRFNDWATISQDFNDAGIVIKNCNISSNGFAGIHCTGVEDITLESNTINLTIEDESPNALNWGSSIKFFECSNIKMVRNDLMGEHATLLWIQGTSNVFIHNNVFWNTNKYNGKCMAVRVYNQNSVGNPDPNNIACLYNTFYLAENENNANSYDFFGSRNDDAKNITGRMTFMYNNCYSYSTKISGKDTENSTLGKFTGSNNNFCPNNFWSAKQGSAATSGFEIKTCTPAYSVNVSELVCETTATGPASLVVRQPENGDGLKVATPITAADVDTYTGITVTDEELTNDRKKDGIRTGDKWTMGAYEATSSNAVSTIYWLGGISSDWDNRNNWAWINASGKEERLTCIDNLDPNLTIIIPEKGSKNPGYPTTTSKDYFYAQLPVSFDSEVREKSGDKIPANEQVNAGKGYGAESKYASSIVLEYGAALKGAHRLVENVDGEDVQRYDKVTTTMTVGRDEWTLVGPVVKPFENGESGAVREVISRDYFLDHEPNVYMHEATIEVSGNNIQTNWGKSFASLEVPVPANTAFAVSLPNSYGQQKVRSKIYYKKVVPDPSKLDDYLMPKSFKPFVGRFVNESELPVYDFSQEKVQLLNNSYPCNLSIDALEGTNNANGTVYVYDYSAASFKTKDAIKGHDGMIRPQNGFVFKSNVEKLAITESMLADGVTRSRSVEQEMPMVRIDLHAGYPQNPIHSSIVIRQDVNLLNATQDSPINAEKVFAPTAGAPELYMIANDTKYARLCVGSASQMIPLGVRLQTPMYVAFAKCTSEDFSQVTLVDVATGEEYDLLKESYTTDMLPAKDTEGRFFLNLTLAEDDEYIEDEENGGNLPTDVEDVMDGSAISIYAADEQTIRVVAANTELQTIYVSDMAGRTMKYDVSGNFAEMRLPVTQGIYLVKVIGDNATRTEKVILK